MCFRPFRGWPKGFIRASSESSKNHREQPRPVRPFQSELRRNLHGQFHWRFLHRPLWGGGGLWRWLRETVSRTGYVPVLSRQFGGDGQRDRLARGNPPGARAGALHHRQRAADCHRRRRAEDHADQPAGERRDLASAAGSLDVPYTLWSSPNLVPGTWTALAIGTVTGSPLVIQDASAAGIPQRYYRLSTQESVALASPYFRA